MKARTLHQIDDQLDNLVAMEAARWGWSWNETAKDLLSRAVGLKKAKKANFSKYLGFWDAKETAEFDKNLKESEQIYKGDW